LLTGYTAGSANPGSITPASTTITILDDGDEDQIQLSTNHRFLLESPNFRAYVVDTPITFFCDLGDASLWRIAGYAITGSQLLIRTALPLSAGQSARASDRIENCSFDYVAGTPTRSGLVTIEIVLESADERVRLLQQVQVQNAP
jgi:MSHA biogenesis protein MshO